MVQLAELDRRAVRSSPAGSSSGWRSPARWSSSPTCCCWTSRWARLTAAPQASAARDPPPAPAPRPHHDLRDPRPGRGAGHVRPHRHHARGRDRADWQRAGALQRPANSFVARFLGESNLIEGRVSGARRAGTPSWRAAAGADDRGLPAMASPSATWPRADAAGVRPPAAERRRAAGAGRGERLSRRSALDRLRLANGQQIWCRRFAREGAAPTESTTSTGRPRKFAFCRNQRCRLIQRKPINREADNDDIEPSQTAQDRRRNRTRGGDRAFWFPRASGAGPAVRLLLLGRRALGAGEGSLHGSRQQGSQDRDHQHLAHQLRQDQSDGGRQQLEWDLVNVGGRFIFQGRDHDCWSRSTTRSSNASKLDKSWVTPYGLYTSTGATVIAWNTGASRRTRDRSRGRTSGT